MFSEFQPAVEHVRQTLDVAQAVHFTQFVRDELSTVQPERQNAAPDKQHLRELYELRSRYLDWELGTGYLGCFSKHAGTRYAFTKIKATMYQMCPPTHKMTVLEIGCGAGLLCLELAQSAKTVVGMDLAHFAIDFANRLRAHLAYPNVSFQVGDAETLMFRDHTFDLVLCSEVLEHLLDPEKALSEIRRVVKATGTVILTTPCAISFSDITMDMFRLFNKHIESGKHVHFDKKTYLAVKRGENEKPLGFSETPGVLNTESFMRVHRRFRYKTFMTMLQHAGFQVEQAAGAVFAFPPHSQVFYRYCPAILLPVIRGIEHLLNRLHLFQRFGSVTTCFRLKPVKR